MFEAKLHVCHVTGWPTGDEIPVEGFFECQDAAREAAETLAERLRRARRYLGMCLMTSVNPVSSIVPRQRAGAETLADY